MEKIVGKIRKILSDKRFGPLLLAALTASLLAFIGDLILGNFSSGLIFITTIFFLLAGIIRNLWEKV